MRGAAPHHCGAVTVGIPIFGDGHLEFYPLNTPSLGAFKWQTVSSRSPAFLLGHMSHFVSTCPVAHAALLPVTPVEPCFYAKPTL